jgi:hypothetical protein
MNEISRPNGVTTSTEISGECAAGSIFRFRECYSGALCAAHQRELSCVCPGRERTYVRSGVWKALLMVRHHALLRFGTGEWYSLWEMRSGRHPRISLKKMLTLNANYEVETLQWGRTCFLCHSYLRCLILNAFELLTTVDCELTDFAIISFIFDQNLWAEC